MRSTGSVEQPIELLSGRAWYGMERKFRYGIRKMPEWNGMEDNLPYFHTNSILDLCIVFTEKYIPMSGSDK